MFKNLATKYAIKYKVNTKTILWNEKSNMKYKYWLVLVYYNSKSILTIKKSLT